jgi:hypothetical protein
MNITRARFALISALSFTFLSLAPSESIAANIPIVLKTLDPDGYQLVGKDCGELRTWDNGGWLIKCDMKKMKLVLIKRPSRLPSKMPNAYVYWGKLIKVNSDGSTSKFELAGVPCSKQGERQGTGEGTYYTCEAKGKSLVWTFNSGSSSGENSNGGSSAVSSLAKTNASKGCADFLPAVQAYYSNFSVLQISIVNGYFLDAKTQDSYYIPLWNAFGELVAIVQKRSVATLAERNLALATFNSYCNTHLSIG